MNCKQCKTRPIFAVKRELCRVCLGRFTANKTNTNRRNQDVARLSRQREVKRSQDEEERNDFLSAFRGAQKALKRLQADFPTEDFSGAMAACQAKIVEYSEIAV
jgi:hypothetical protein